jgi:hypothetical protein
MLCGKNPFLEIIKWQPENEGALELLSFSLLLSLI